MKLARLALALTVLTSSTAALATKPATHSFELFVNNKKTAVTTYTLEKNKDGLKIKSAIDYLADGIGNPKTNTYKIGADGILDGASISNPLDRTTLFFTPSKANDSISIGGFKGSTPIPAQTVPLKPSSLVVAFPDDPSVWQVVLEVTAAHPHDDKIYHLLIPSTEKVAGRIEPYRLSAPTEAKGTLDGQPIALKHYTLQFNAGTSDLYCDADGNLMQAKIGMLHITHTRVNFTLEP